MNNNLLQRPGVSGSSSSGNASVARGRKKDRETDVAADREKPFSCECESGFPLYKMSDYSAICVLCRCSD